MQTTTSLDATIQQKIDLKTKPHGALGYLENVAFQIAKVQQTLQPQLSHPAMIVFAADHGLAQSGVSAYPAEVTFQMVSNFLAGGAAINVFCRQHNIDIKIVDAGVNFDFEPSDALIVKKAGYGTHNMLAEPAMSREQLEYCLEAPKSIIHDVAKQGCNIIGFGEMGIGNTSAAALIMSAVTGIPIEHCVGKGTGVNAEQLKHKINTLSQVFNKYAPLQDPKEILRTFGGFEIAQMTGAFLHAYEHNMLLMVDGFIATAALSIAHQLVPEILNNCIFCHNSDEQAHQCFIEFLGGRPLLNLNMRVGEGIGCAVAYPIIESAVKFFNEMASFESAGVSNKE